MSTGDRHTHHLPTNYFNSFQSPHLTNPPPYLLPPTSYHPGPFLPLTHFRKTILLSTQLVQNMMRMQSLVMLFCILLQGTVVLLTSAAAPSIEQECSSQFSKVGVCLNFATGKAETPSKECCSTVQEIRDKDAVCLCYVIQQVHDGASALKQMGLQEAKLLQLPTACKLVNATISQCPKLLNLPANSPDNAIFKDSPASATPSTPVTSTTASPTKMDSSMGFVDRPLIAIPTMMAATVAVLGSMFFF